MDGSAWIAVGSLIVAFVSASIATFAVVESRRLQRMQWKRDDLELRRDVLRRLYGYRYRLTGSLMGTDGEPFVALNEARIVYAGFPNVVAALNRMQDELGVEGRLTRNIVALVTAMADAADISVKDLDDKLVVSPFTPPSNIREE